MPDMNANKTFGDMFDNARHVLWTITNITIVDATVTSRSVVKQVHFKQKLIYLHVTSV